MFLTTGDSSSLINTRLTASASGLNPDSHENKGSTYLLNHGNGGSSYPLSNYSGEGSSYSSSKDYENEGQTYSLPDHNISGRPLWDCELPHFDYELESPPIELPRIQMDPRKSMNGSVLSYVATSVTLKVLSFNDITYMKFKQLMYSHSTLIECVYQKLAIPISKTINFIFKLNGTTISRSSNTIVVLSPDDNIVISALLVGGNKNSKTLSRPKKNIKRKVLNTIRDIKTGGLKKLVASNRKAIMRTSDGLVDRIFSAKYTAPITQNHINMAKDKNNALLSACSAKYAGLLIDPFNPLFNGACNPALSVSQSEKTTTNYGFDFAIGTAGVGFVLMVGGNATDGVSMFITNSAFAGTRAAPISAVNTLTAGVTYVTNSQLRYTSAQLSGSGVGDQPVSTVSLCTSLRVTYTGTTMNESGMVYCYTDPNHGSVSGMNTSDIASRPECNVRPATRKPCELTISANDVEGNIFPTGYISQQNFYTWSRDTNYLSVYRSPGGFTYSDPGGRTTNCPVGLIMVTGVPGSTFHGDVVQHNNSIGPLANVNYTPHGSDVVGAAQVQTAMSSLEQLKKAKPDSKIMALFKIALTTAQEGLKRVAIPATIEALERLVI